MYIIRCVCYSVLERKCYNFHVVKEISKWVKEGVELEDFLINYIDINPLV